MGAVRERLRRVKERACARQEGECSAGCSACPLPPLSALQFSNFFLQPLPVSHPPSTHPLPAPQRAATLREGEDDTMAPRGNLVFAAGVGSLVFVPVFKQLTGLPPYLGMLLGLGGLWVLTDAVHYGEPQRSRLKVGQALARIDTQGVLFFLGILMSVSAMSSMGLLKELAVLLNEKIPDIELVAVIIGLVSAAIDNVPLVAVRERA